MLFQQGFTTLAAEKIQTVEIVESYDWYDVVITGVYPYYLQVYTRINIDNLKTRDDLSTLKTDMQSIAQTDSATLLDNEVIQAKITFNNIMNVDKVLEFVKRYSLEVDRFGFTASDGRAYLRGQGTPSADDVIPLNELKSFICEFELVGIHSIDVSLDPNILVDIIDDESVAIANFLAYRILVDAGVNPVDFDEVLWNTEDPSWYINHMFL